MYCKNCARCNELFIELTNSRISRSLPVHREACFKDIKDVSVLLNFKDKLFSFSEPTKSKIAEVIREETRAETLSSQTEVKLMAKYLLEYLRFFESLNFEFYSPPPNGACIFPANRMFFLSDLLRDGRQVAIEEGRNYTAQLGRVAANAVSSALAENDNEDTKYSKLLHQKYPTKENLLEIFHLYNQSLPEAEQHPCPAKSWTKERIIEEVMLLIPDIDIFFGNLERI